MQMRVALITLLLSSTQALDAKPIRGLDPALSPRYIPNSAGNFVCLDGSKEIPFERINDDYCDCPDGSDEPGTAACNNGSFYCANKGHIPARIRSSKVNDGLCDPACCDGSDEWDSGVDCPNVCKEVGRAYREREAQLRQTRTAGSRRRSTLEEEAITLRKVKELELTTLESKLSSAEERLKAAEELKNALEERERELRESSDKEREARKQKIHDEYLPSLVVYRKFMNAQMHELRHQRDSLILLLRSVKVDHNPEFNDEAVSECISAYSEYIDAVPYMEAAALEYSNEDEKARKAREGEMDRENEQNDDTDYTSCKDATNLLDNEYATIIEDIALLYNALDALRAGYNKNYHDLAIKAAVVGLEDYEKTSAKTDAMLGKLRVEMDIENVSVRIEEASKQLSEISGTSSSNEGESEDKEGAAPAAAAAAPAAAADVNKDGPKETLEAVSKQLSEIRSEYWSINTEKTDARNALTNAQELLSMDLGPKDIYLPLKGECFSLDAGEYTYEVCLLDKAAQISNKDSTRQHLGSFTEFGTLENGETDYTTLKYLNGAKCWNGPNRSLIAKFECAKDINVISVTEPEKCEYHATITGPFACPPFEGDNGTADDKRPAEIYIEDAVASLADDVDDTAHVHDEL